MARWNVTDEGCVMPLGYGCKPPVLTQGCLTEVDIRTLVAGVELSGGRMKHLQGCPACQLKLDLATRDDSLAMDEEDSEY